MPGYVVEMPTFRCEAYGGFPCPKKATHQAQNAYNAVMGHYCRPHAEKVVREYNEREGFSGTKK